MVSKHKIDKHHINSLRQSIEELNDIAELRQRASQNLVVNQTQVE